MIIILEQTWYYELISQEIVGKAKDDESAKTMIRKLEKNHPRKAYTTLYDGIGDEKSEWMNDWVNRDWQKIVIGRNIRRAIITEEERDIYVWIETHAHLDNPCAQCLAFHESMMDSLRRNWNNGASSHPMHGYIRLHVPLDKKVFRTLSQIFEMEIISLAKYKQANRKRDYTKNPRISSLADFFKK